MKKKYVLRKLKKGVEVKKDEAVTENKLEPESELRPMGNPLTPSDERQTINAKYEFTEPEKKEMAEKLAQRQIELIEAQDEKKTATATFADRIKRIQLDISKLSRGYRDGWEFRDHEVTVIYDYPNKEKRFKDIQTGKIVHKLPFGPGDEQRRFA